MNREKKKGSGAFEQYLHDYEKMGSSHQFWLSPVHPVSHTLPDPELEYYSPPITPQRQNGFVHGYSSSGYSSSVYSRSVYNAKKPNGEWAVSRYRPGGSDSFGDWESDEASLDDDHQGLVMGVEKRYSQNFCLPPIDISSENWYETNLAAILGPINVPSEDWYDTNLAAILGPEWLQLTAEVDEKDIEATKQKISSIKQENVASTRNALQLALQANESKRASFIRLSTPKKRPESIQRSLYRGSMPDQIARERIQELEQLRRSIYSAHVPNPFAGDRMDMEALERHPLEREQQVPSFGVHGRKSACVSRRNARRDSGKAMRVKRSMYQFETDSEGEEMEGNINYNSGFWGSRRGV
jgi:hypothetical protein